MCYTGSCPHEDHNGKCRRPLGIQCPWVEEEFDDGDNCDHNWKHYVGFKEEYYFCEKCGLKTDSLEEIEIEEEEEII